MAKYLLSLFALQTLALLAGLGDSVQQVYSLLGVVGLDSRPLALGLVTGEVWVACYAVYDLWRKEREARERLTR